jgi:integrase
MGLGSLHTFGLAEAREIAKEKRQLIHKGIDPIDAKQGAKAIERTEKAKLVTFRQAAEAYIRQKETEKKWRNEKHRKQWAATLEQYAYPAIGHLPVYAVDTALVLKILKPIWPTRTETAARLRGRIATVLDAAKADGLRSGDNPAAWDNLKNSLGRPADVKKANNRGKNHAALAYADIPAFLTKLRKDEGIAARALEFTIATAARTGEVIGARWSEIDFDYRDREKGQDGFAGPVWTIPAERMKSGREHRVPLAPKTAEFLRKMRPADGGSDHYIFHGRKPNKPLSNMAMLVLIQRRLKLAVTVHGFRSGFRTWTAEETDTPRDIAEAALAHVVGDKVERAYQRGALLKKRALLMTRWSEFIEGKTATGNNVVHIGGGRA